MRYLKQSTSVDVGIGPFLDESDGKTAETALTITQPDVRLKKNNGNWAQKAAAQTLTHEENGWYEVTLDGTDTDTIGILLVAVHESGALPVWMEFHVLAANVYDSLFGAATDKLDVNVEEWNTTAVPSEHTAGYPIVTIKDGTGTGEINTNAGAVALVDLVTTTTTATNVTTVNGLAANVITAASIADGAIDAGAIASDAITAAKIAADAITDAKVASDVTIASVTGAVGSVTGNVGGNVAGSVGSVTGAVGSVGAGGIAAASFATGAITAAVIADNAIDAGAIADGAIDAATFAAGAINAAAIADAAIDAATFASGAITADAIAADAIGASELAASAVTEIQSGLSTLDAAGVRTAVGLASANLDTQLDAIPTAAENAAGLLDVAAGVETNRTVRQSLRLMLAALVGKLSGAATTTVAIRDTNDSKDRISATVDASGNRTAVTLDGT